MTPREKALQLIDAFDEYAESRISDNGRGFDKKYCSKQCALIAVDEIIEEIVEWAIVPRIDYWSEVRQEIENM